jgi:hypothetical protein
MNKISFLTGSIFVFFYNFSYGQSLKNSFGVSINYVRINQIDAIGISYLVKYSRYFSEDNNNKLDYKISYLSVENSLLNNPIILPDYNPKNGPCFTNDLTLSHNFIKKNVHSLWFGIGPSLWFINNIYKTPTIKVAKIFNITEIVTIAEEKINGTRLGYSAEVLYEYSPSTRFSIGVYLSYKNIEELKATYWLGLNGRYKF